MLILREVLEFSAAEVAEMLETSVAAVNSALQRLRLVPATVNGQLAFAAYQGGPDGTFRHGGVNVLTVRGALVGEITSFLDPAWLTPFGLPEILPGPPMS